MIDLADLRARPDVYEQAIKNKHLEGRVTIKVFLALDEKRREILKEVEEMRARQNTASKKIPLLKGAEKESALAEMKQLSDKLKEHDAKLKSAEQSWQEMALWLPSLPLNSVPVGKDDSENVEVEKWGEPPTFSFTPKDHVQLGEELGILDIARGVKIAGSRSCLLMGDGARLEQALLRYTMDHLVVKGFTLVSPPVLAGWEAFMGMGHFPGSEEQTYAVGVQERKDDPLIHDQLYLIGTSEVALLAAHQDEVLPTLPLKLAGVSACFRREAGTYGKDTKGLYRVHQFQKVEQVIFCEADEKKALALHREIRTNAEEVLQALGLAYRIVDVCTGDMGQGKVYMQDIETWMPSREAYCETHSCSYLGDFQARRLNVRYEDGGEKKYVYTLNNTCIASPRILIPLLETYQQQDGSVLVPEVLRPYMKNQEKIVPM